MINIYPINGVNLNQSKKTSREVSYSKNVFLPITNICRNNCSYCGFRKEPGEESWFMSPEQVLELAEKGKNSGCSEALITLGEKPEECPEAREELEEFGYDSTVDYLEEMCKEILDIGLLPHTNPGVLDKKEIKRLGRYSASMGLMLECVNELPVHRNSPGKDPDLRLENLEIAGELKVPFTTGILIGVGESWSDRIQSLLKLRYLQEEYNHIQEIIIQPFKPKSGTLMENASPPTRSEMSAIVMNARRMMPDMNIQVPPNLTPELLDYLEMGANDLGGISTLTPDFINPEHPWPKIKNLRNKLGSKGFKLKERLPIYPNFVKNEEFMSPEVKEVVKELSNENGYREQ
ncbi:MAG: 7,8-didemethyl-8-hydroxy-5-deazariboflavin synthase subunit CofG [Hadesarchaea archaeon]|nr:7,8-didemethyl-8-hydroxy-5-deazariboflavin synthase subunit CofG [Hadesarchaea archaeon]